MRMSRRYGGFSPATRSSLAIVAFSVGASLLGGCSDTPLEPVVKSTSLVAPAIGNDGQSLTISVRTKLRSTQRRAGGRQSVTTVDSTSTTIRARTFAGGQFAQLPVVGLRAAFSKSQASQALTGTGSQAIRAPQRLQVAERAFEANVLCKDERKWTQRFASADGTTLIMEGIGDAPVHRTQLVRDGKLLMTEEFRWVRRRSEWQMVRHTTSDPTNSIVEEVSVIHPRSENWSGFASSSLNAEVVRVGCGASNASAAPVSTRRYRAQIPNGIGSGALGAEVSLDCADPTGRCETQNSAMKSAARKVNILVLVTILVCLIPEPAEPAACVAAGGALAIAQVDYNDAKAAYDTCIASGTPPGGATPILSVATAQTLSLSIAGSWPNSAKADVSSVQLTCGDSGGGGYGGGSGQVSCHIENWEISYDSGATWEPIQIEVCE
jgi:hypothetical protein